jgi:hypothetical protein
MEDAVIISAPSTYLGVRAEYAFVEMQCGRQGVDWKTAAQALWNGPDGKRYDVLTVELKDATVRKFYFDISSFYGKF